MIPVAQGFVTQVGRRTFWARLRRPRGRSWFEAEIEKSKLSTRERPRLVEGAYMALLKGGTVRFSRVHWTQSCLKRRRHAAQSLLSVFGDVYESDGTQPSTNPR